MNTNKKTIAFVGIGIIVLLIAVGLFFWIQKDESSEGSVFGFLPFGLGGDDVIPGPVTPPNNTNNGPVGGTAVGNIPGLQKISDGPVSGSTIFAVGSTTLVRYADRATGNIYEFNAQTKSRVRISNTTIPQAYSVAWGIGGESFLFQSIQNGLLQNYFARLATTTASSTNSEASVTGKYLDDSITSFVFSPKKEATFFLSKTSFGVDGYLANRIGEQGKKIWSFRTSEWIPSWQTGEIVHLTTKTDGNSEGYLYSLNTKTGSFTPILSNIVGLSTLINPSGDLVLYSKTEESKLLLYSYSVSSKTSTIVPFPTFPEKCVWSSANTAICAVPIEPLSANALESWNKGVVSYNDFLRTHSVGDEITSFSITADRVELKDQNGQGMDVINPKVSADGTLFMFENKKDMSLWVLPLNTSE